MDTAPQQQEDPFAGTPSDDPFEGGVEPDLGDPADEVAAEQPETVVEDGVEVRPEQAAEARSIPTVDKEGNPVPAEGEQPAEAPQEPQQPAEAPAPPEPAPEPQQPEEAPQPAPAPQQPAEAAQAPQEGAQQPSDDVQSGKAAMRYYKVLYQTGPSTWEEAKLDPANDNVVRDAEGVAWLAARNNEHATRLSWGILGRPENGVTCFPVPKGAWKPRRLAPAPPAPERERLVIS